MSNRKPNSPQPRRRRAWIVTVIIVLILGWAFLNPGRFNDFPSVSINEIVSSIQAGDVNRITVVGGTQIIAQLWDGRRFGAYMSPSPGFVPLMTSLGVTMGQLGDFEYAERPSDNTVALIFQVLFSSVPILLIAFPIYWFMRTFRHDQQEMVAFSRMRQDIRIEPEMLNTRFSDVGGMDAVKAALTPIIRFVHEPEQFIVLGAELPKAALLTGAPGSGKSLLARAFAGELGIPFFQINGSDFAEMFVGVGASRIRDLFQQAEAAAPSLIFIDELDVIGYARGAASSDRVDNRQTLQQLLTQLDDVHNNVIVIGASNRPDLLDPALMRSGRFDKRIELESPDLNDRTAILSICTKNKPLAPDVDLNAIAAQAEGMVAADLARLANEAAMIAALGTRKRVTMRDFEDALQRLKA